ncbi:guanylate kinase [candidate division WOR-3 bacterium RBG_13_43_14]|uniref:Guanylate kinase n=1 Tax=candidate division WOR-3 bacterium RBG_13_43_14 TaxID=1802590 RepID=A0A1F4U9A5_UNCW3|nr:MAG: guanylate kinase [candidate division WOR-3 bacterium RBG_13_43_14]
MSNKGRVIVISGPSGVGKSTICNIILKKRNDLWFSISTTSRVQRKGEQQNREYIFISKSSFLEQIKQNRFLEYAEVHGNLYGTPREPLEKVLEGGKNVLLDIDVQGAQKIMTLFSAGIFIFLIPPKFGDLKERLQKRNTDNTDEISKRLIQAQKEMEYMKDYKYIIQNIKIADTVRSILEILKNELDRNAEL